jgi:hypothetical protein
MIEDTFHLIPRTTVNLNLYGLTKKWPWRRTDVRCSETIWTRVYNIVLGIQELKTLRVIKLYSVGTGQSSDVERSNKHRTEILVRKIQVNMCRGKPVRQNHQCYKNRTLSNEHYEYENHLSYDVSNVQATDDHNFGPPVLGTDSKCQRPHYPYPWRERFLILTEDNKTSLTDISQIWLSKNPSNLWSI